MGPRRKYKHSCSLFFSIPLLELVIEPFPTGMMPCFLNSKKTLKCTYLYASANSEQSSFTEMQKSE